MIRKTKKGTFKLISKKGKSLGEYRSRKQAMKREAQINFWKHHK